MNHAIQVLKTRASEIKQKVAELENIEPEMNCDLIFAENEINNLNIVLKEINEAISYLYNKNNK